MKATPPRTPLSASGAAGVNAYLARLPTPDRAALEAIRRVVRREAPEAEELLSYRMPAFRQAGMLVYYAGFRDHLSFFPGSVVTARRFARELLPFSAGKGTIHFTPEKPIPLDLIARIVRARVVEDLRRLEARRRKNSGKPRRGAARPGVR